MPKPGEIVAEGAAASEDRRLRWGLAALLPSMGEQRNVMFIGMLLLGTFTNSVAAVAWSSAISEIVPERVSGRYFARRNLIFGAWERANPQWNLFQIRARTDCFDCWSQWRREKHADESDLRIGAGDWWPGRAGGQNDYECATRNPGQAGHGLCAAGEEYLSVAHRERESGNGSVYTQRQLPAAS